ncbi:hypothetical protein [Neobacillus sp. FSL H8-0543]
MVFDVGIRVGLEDGLGRVANKSREVANKSTKVENKNGIMIMW